MRNPPWEAEFKLTQGLVNETLYISHELCKEELALGYSATLAEARGWALAHECPVRAYAP